MAFDGEPTGNSQVDMLPDEVTQRRVADADATFRSANERMRNTAEQFGMEERVPFFCECANPSCQEIVQLSIKEYEQVRRSPRQFLNIPGHEAAARGAGAVVADHGRYVVVEKLGLTGEIVEELDERVE